MSDSGVTPADRFIGDLARHHSGSPGRMKRPSEAYKCERPTAMTKSGKAWKNTPGVGTGGSPIFGGREPTLPSEKDLAMLGSLAKFRAARQLRSMDITLTEHEAALIREAAETVTWAGEPPEGWVCGLRDGARVKALLDDTTSGGSYINPEFFDTAVITYPLLHGELVPYVDVQNLPRGSSVATAGIGNVTVTWGTAEGTALDLFDTTGLISQITVTIFSVATAVQIGRDELADTPLNLGAIIANRLGEKLLFDLDNKIANGDGTSQLEGLFVASGTTSIASENGSAGGYTIGDVERHVFGLSKEYRVNAWNPRFIMSDTAYRRMSQVPVGASDARRVLHPDMRHESYELMGRGVSIQNNISNGYSAFASLKKAYRLWRRQGSEMRWIDGGAELAKTNTVLLVMRARYGGKVVDPNAVCKMTDGDSTDG